MACARRSGKAKRSPSYRQIRGYGLPRAPVQSANSSIQGSQRMRCSQQVAASDRPLRAGIPRPAIPGRQNAQVPANWPFLRILAQSPFLDLTPAPRPPQKHSSAGRPADERVDSTSPLSCSHLFSCVTHRRPPVHVKVGLTQHHTPSPILRPLIAAAIPHEPRASRPAPAPFAPPRPSRPRAISYTGPVRPQRQLAANPAAIDEPQTTAGRRGLQP